MKKQCLTPFFIFYEKTVPDPVFQGQKQLEKYIKAFKDNGLGDFRGVLETYQKE